jgi:hypothetical protein
MECAVKYVADMLKYNNSITHLNLANNYIRKAITFLTSSLNSNKSFTHLNLSDNYREFENATSLLNVLEQRQIHTSLDLRAKIDHANDPTSATCKPAFSVGCQLQTIFSLCKINILLA